MPLKKPLFFRQDRNSSPDDFLFNSKSNAYHETNSLNLEENEKQLVSRAIEKHRGNLSQAAKSLGINRSTLYEKIKRYGL